MKKFILLCSLGLLVAAFACNPSGTKNKKETAAQSAYSDESMLQVARANFKVLPTVANNPANAVTPEKVKLGKMLFYDTRLSKNGNNSCNTCHNLKTFGVDNEPTSEGDGGKRGNRNSPTVFNAALHSMQFWDGRAKDVEEQAGGPILNPIEMGMPHKDILISRLTGVPQYQQLFKAAFPGEARPINYQNLQKAIGAFERTLLTPSRFDKYMQGDKNALNAEEKAGLMAFVQSGCTTCHNGVGVGGGTMQRFGLVTDYRTFTHSRINDEGRKSLTHFAADKDVFKVPGLRNVGGTYPYFHDGSVAELDSAVTIMAKAQLNRHLSRQELKQIVAFLNALKGDISPEAKVAPDDLAKK